MWMIVGARALTVDYFCDRQILDGNGKSTPSRYRVSSIRKVGLAWLGIVGARLADFGMDSAEQQEAQTVTHLHQDKQLRMTQTSSL